MGGEAGIRTGKQRWRAGEVMVWYHKKREMAKRHSRVARIETLTVNHIWVGLEAMMCWNSDG